MNPTRKYCFMPRRRYHNGYKPAGERVFFGATYIGIIVPHGGAWKGFYLAHEEQTNFVEGSSKHIVAYLLRARLVAQS